MQNEIIKSEDGKHEVIKWSLLNCQVCSSGTIDEALEWLQKAMPAGTTNNWQIDERPEVAPVECSNEEGRKHYVFTC